VNIVAVRKKIRMVYMLNHVEISIVLFLTIIISGCIREKEYGVRLIKPESAFAEDIFADINIYVNYSNINSKQEWEYKNKTFNNANELVRYLECEDKAKYQGSVEIMFGKVISPSDDDNNIEPIITFCVSNNMCLFVQTANSGEGMQYITWYVRATKNNEIIRKTYGTTIMNVKEITNESGLIELIPEED